MLKFPKSPLTPEDEAKIAALFQADVRPLFEGSSTLVSYFTFNAATQEGLRITARTGCLSQGLESIARILDDEKKGLVEVQKRTGQSSGQRMSRLLFLSNDGSERFYRQAASVLTNHGNRVWCLRLDASSEDLGNLVASRKNPAKAIMINDKKALGLFLRVFCHLPPSVRQASPS